MSSSEALFLAIRRNDLAGVKAALAAGVDARGLSELGFPALVSAAHDGHADLFEVLYAAGARLDARVRDGDMALHRAAKFGYFSERRRDATMVKDFERFVALALEKGGDPNAVSGGATAIAMAAEHGTAKALEAMLAVPGADPNKAPSPQFRPLDLSVATRHEGRAKLNALLAAGADPNGRVAMALAIERREATEAEWIVERLLQAGADAGWSEPETGWTPLMSAVVMQAPAIVERLRAAGAPTDVPVSSNFFDHDIPRGATPRSSAIAIATEWMEEALHGALRLVGSPAIVSDFSDVDLTLDGLLLLAERVADPDARALLREPETRELLEEGMASLLDGLERARRILRAVLGEPRLPANSRLTEDRVVGTWKVVGVAVAPDWDAIPLEIVVEEGRSPGEVTFAPNGDVVARLAYDGELRGRWWLRSGRLGLDGELAADVMFDPERRCLSLTFFETAYELVRSDPPLP